MTDYETETEGTTKKLRRRRRDWLNPEITQMYEAIDTYANAELDAVGIIKNGNVGYTRIQIPRHDDERPPVMNLPYNVYHREWLATKDERFLHHLNVTMDEQTRITIPKLVGGKCSFTNQPKITTFTLFIA